jgi:transposase-like protein
MPAKQDPIMTMARFLELFPSSDACLDYLKERFHPDGAPCPKCRKPTKFHRLKRRSAYSCQYCGHQVYPTKGTIFERSTTSLQLWFWTIYLMSSTRGRLPAKQLQREIGVTQKTASRMSRDIRALLGESA